MEEDWIGKAVSIECDAKLGVFQGVIKEISETRITITRVFRNGVPLRKQDAEVTLRSTDIVNISVIPSYAAQSGLQPTVINKPTPVKQPNFPNAGNGSASNCGGVTTPTNGCNGGGGGSGGVGFGGATSALSNQLSNMKLYNGADLRSTPTSSRAGSAHLLQPSSMNGSSAKSSPPMLSSISVAQFFGNLIPPKVEVRMGASFAGAGCVDAAPPDVFSFRDITNGGEGGGALAEMDGLVNGAMSQPIDIINSRHSHHNQTALLGQSASYSNGGGGAGNGNGTASGTSNGNGNGKMRQLSVGGGGGNGGGGNGSKKQQRKQVRRENSIKQNQTFGTSVDDPQLHEDFDFEGNLALFNKQAVWDELEAEQKPDLLRQTEMSGTKKYRHDENILAGVPLQLRQIETMFAVTQEFVTDEGLIIPTIPSFVRSKIEMSADKDGLSMQRQGDLLGRGTTDLAISLLGGARRLTPNNCHQWPKVVIICEKSANFRASNVGATTGRQLASHGLKVLLYLEEDQSIEQKSIEISLFKATGNTLVYSVNALSKPDLVILSTNSINLSGDVKKWLSENRASIVAVDPPPSGIRDVSIKYAILPILPLNGISSNNCGKLYLCNLGIPDKYYRDAGIKYKSPFGHKFVIPIHSKD